MNRREIAAEYRLSHWRGIMRDRAERGLTVKAYCAEGGFHENVYYYWQRKLREAAVEEMTRNEEKAMEASTTKSPAVFTEIKLLEAISHQATETMSPGQINIEVSGMRVKADMGYPVKQLAELLREVTGVCYH